mgnify:CR=1 FL=1
MLEASTVSLQSMLDKFRILSIATTVFGKMNEIDKGDHSTPPLRRKNLLLAACSGIVSLFQRCLNRVSKSAPSMGEQKASDLKEVKMNGRHGEKVIAKLIPQGCSPVRFAISQVTNTRYKPINGFEEGLNTQDAVLIMEGDWGGQIYLTCPMKLVHCSEEALETLLTDLDDIAWDCNEGLGTGIYYEVRKAGEMISGGMGGGFVLDTLWVYPEFDNLEREIRDVIEGRSGRIKTRKKTLRRMWFRWREFLMATSHLLRLWRS